MQSQQRSTARLAACRYVRKTLLNLRRLNRDSLQPLRDLGAKGPRFLTLQSTCDTRSRPGRRRILKTADGGAALRASAVEAPTALRCLEQVSRLSGEPRTA